MGRNPPLPQVSPTGQPFPSFVHGLTAACCRGLVGPTSHAPTRSRVKAKPGKPNPSATQCRCAQPSVVGSASPSAALPQACATHECPYSTDPSSAWICLSARNRLEETEASFIPKWLGLAPSWNPTNYQIDLLDRACIGYGSSHRTLGVLPYINSAPESPWKHLTLAAIAT
jgi:hypothetical protein